MSSVIHRETRGRFIPFCEECHTCHHPQDPHYITDHFRAQFRLRYGRYPTVDDTRPRPATSTSAGTEGDGEQVTGGCIGNKTSTPLRR